MKNKLKQKLIDYKKKQFDKAYGELENSVELFEAKITEGIVEELCEVIDQLDEPEVLSQEWIEYNVSFIQSGRRYVLEDRLQNLLVPKQELPVIPNYVAKWISEHHERFDLYPALKRLENNAWSWEDVHEWYRKNTHKFVNAYLTGKYKVEEEQKYYVMNNDNRMMLVRMMDGKTITESDPFPLGELYDGERKSHRLTEQEIKDYDERYWPFAVKVEELEG